MESAQCVDLSLNEDRPGDLAVQRARWNMVLFAVVSVATVLAWPLS